MKEYFSNIVNEYEQPERFLLTCFPPDHTDGGDA